MLQAAVIAISHEKWQERLAAGGAPAGIDRRRAGDPRPHETEDRELVDAPDAVEFLDEFPMTGTGKVQKLLLREKFKGYQAKSA